MAADKDSKRPDGRVRETRRRPPGPAPQLPGAGGVRAARRGGRRTARRGHVRVGSDQAAGSVGVETDLGSIMTFHSFLYISVLIISSSFSGTKKRVYLAPRSRRKNIVWTYSPNSGQREGGPDCDILLKDYKSQGSLKSRYYSRLAK